jgi:hypothetical protein
VTDFRLNPAFVSSPKSKLVSNTLVWNGFKDGFPQAACLSEKHLLENSARHALLIAHPA